MLYLDSLNAECAAHSPAMSSMKSSMLTRHAHSPSAADGAIDLTGEAAHAATNLHICILYRVTCHNNP